MKIYPEELLAYEKYKSETSFAYYSPEQKAQIKNLIKTYSAWHLKHPYLHNCISLVLVAALVFLDLYCLTYIGLNENTSGWHTLLLTVAHGLLMYNIIGYTLHEGAYHRLIILERGPLTKVLNFFAMNICRLWYCDPVYYRQNHHGHHVHIGTEKDGTFTNFIHPRRFFVSLGPLASALNYNDYKLHTGEVWTKSKILSESLSFGMLVLIGLWTYFTHHSYEVLLQYVAVAFFGAWISFILDRVRESTEHNLMPNDPFHGAREFGVNFTGLLFGGGPWGQPCHHTHHLAPGLPWYQQLRFHFQLKKVMTPEQKKQFCVHPLWGVPVLLGHVLSENKKRIEDLP
ncbi:fatty acid desaturase [Bdellovibrio sp. HCB337]|uniref:fatty acid desaturase n=1 Tax=Bdellovibrio sp. HCB337 TaxID=3394358 RepID=UPI0039A3FF28